MDATQRRRKILKTLESSETPVSASSLADQLSVSRQIIVGDVAILRASGAHILATPRGYVYEIEAPSSFPYEGLLACRHAPEQLKDELYTIVDFGGFVIDVIIEHTLYGQLSGLLNIGSRYDADLFLHKVEEAENAKPLSLLTGGIHLHRIGCKSEETFQLIRQKLDALGIIIPANN